MKHLSRICFCCLLCTFFFTAPGQTAARGGRLSIDSRGFVSFKAGNDSLLKLLGQLASAAGVDIFLPNKIPGMPMAGSFDHVSVKDALDRLLRGYSYAVIYSGAANGQVRFYGNDKLPFQPISVAPDTQGQAQTGFGTGTAARREGSQFSVKESGDELTWVHEIEDMAVSPETMDTNTARAVKALESQSSKNNISAVPVSSSTEDASTKENESSSFAPEAFGTNVHAGTSSDDDSSEVENGVLTQAETGTLFSNSYDNLSDAEKEIVRLGYQIAQLEEEIESGRADALYEHWAAYMDPKNIYNHRKELEYKQKQLEELLANQ
ncbi:MAG: hypothetical protein HUN04_25705 [Desulfobacter sp.]|nr:MAG: hypothetical protein HUN04_25705 [Desulfobacter sp.]